MVQQFKLILRQVKGRFFWLMGIGHQTGQEIDHAVDPAPMAGLFNLADVFELIVDRVVLQKWVVLYSS